MTGQNTKNIPNRKIKRKYLAGQNARQISDRVKFKKHTGQGKSNEKYTRKVPDRAK